MTPDDCPYNLEEFTKDVLSYAPAPPDPLCRLTGALLDEGHVAAASVLAAVVCAVGQGSEASLATHVAAWIEARAMEVALGEEVAVDGIDLTGIPGEG